MSSVTNTFKCVLPLCTMNVWPTNSGMIVQALARMIRTLKAKGYTVVMVEQNFRFAAPLADRLHVMEHGAIVESFGAHQLQDKLPVLQELLGV